MTGSMTAVRTALAVAAGLLVASPAFAQDKGTDVKRNVTTVAPQAPADTAREDATRTMPVWESFGESGTENLAETMYRLTREFQSTSDLGVRRLGAVPIWPRGDLKIGNVRILPYLREGVEYQSNFYKKSLTGANGAENANESAWTHQNQVGILADMALAGGRLNLAASADVIWNVRYDEGNPDRGRSANGNLIDPEKPDTTEFTGEFAAAYRFPSGVYVRGGIAFEQRDDPIDADPSSTEFQRTNRRTFLTAGMDRDIIFGSKFRFELGMNVRDTIGRTDGLDDLDRTETGFYLKASYPFWKNTTRIFGRARYRQDERESDRINDGDVLGFDAGIEGSIPLREGEYKGLRGQVSIGFDSALYESDTFGTGPTAVIRDDGRRNASLSASAILQYMMSRKTTIDLRFLRTNQFSFHGNYQIVDRFDLSVVHNISPSLAGRVATFFEYSDPSGLLRQRPVAGGPEGPDYPSSTRFGVGTGLRYKLNDWLDADMNFEWERRNNRLTGFTNYTASLGLTMYLNALKPRRAAEQ